jgi:hypothetical protein
MKAVAIVICLGVLCACADANDDQIKGSYNLDHGVATYDALRTATDKCKAEGGKIKLKSGYDDRELSSYDCKIGEAR